MPLTSPYRLPDGSIVDILDSTTRGMREIDYTLKGGEVVAAIRIEPTALTPARTIAPFLAPFSATELGIIAGVLRTYAAGLNAAQQITARTSGRPLTTDEIATTHTLTELAKRAEKAAQEPADDFTDDDPNEQYYGEGDAGRGNHQTTGEHLRKGRN